MNKYYTPEIEEFHVGFEYEEFETIRNDIKVDEKFKLYSVEYFQELHSNDKYWRHRKFISKVCDKTAVYNFPSTFLIEKYVPLLIENKYRVKYLGREDIEEVLGVKQLKGDDVELNFQILQEDSEDFYEVDYDIDILELNVELYKEVSENRSNCYTLFSGKIKNKSELQKLMKQLGICKK